MAGPAVYIETYGCQMNVLDSELVHGALEQAGYTLTDRQPQAQVVLINTCSVRELAEQKAWSQLGRLGVRKREGEPQLVIGVLGCMAEREGANILKRMPYVDLVCGPSTLDKLPALLDNALRNRTPQVALAGHTTRRSQTLDAAQQDGVEALDLSRSFSPDRSQTQAYVRITRGCNKFCSFCVVPFTRGPEVHRPPEQVVDEVQKLTDHGALEVTLIGQTVNHYRHGSTSFADLLRLVHDRVPALPRLRFVTSYPRDFTDDALDAMAASPRICRYLHIPVQSGSNRLLRLMNRGYTVEEYLALLERARARMPDIRLATDMIVGFPTETEEDHQASLALLRQGRFKSAFIFKYSERPGTVAERRLDDDVPEEVKRRRNLELLDAQSEVSLTHNRERIGERLHVLVEGMSKLRAHAESGGADGELVQLAARPTPPSGGTRLIGRTSGDEIVAFDGPAGLVGGICSVRAVGATGLTILAQLQPHEEQACV